MDTAASGAGATLAYSISAGSDRLLVVALSAEDATDPVVSDVDYGGQAMTLVRSEIANPGSGTRAYVSVWYLLESGIAAAVGTTITPNYSGVNDSETISAASYAGVRQSSPVIEHQGDNTAGSTPNPFTTVDLVESSGNLILAAGANGNDTTASWQADLTEQTDQQDGSSTGSMADRLSTTEGSVTVELTWASQNRACIISVHFAQVGAEPSCLREVSGTGSPTSTSTSYVVIPGMEMTPGGGDYLAWFTTSVNGTGGLPGSIFIALFVDGTIVAHTEREIHFDSSMEDTTFLLAATHALVQPTDGQAVDIRWRASSLTTMTVLQRTLNLIKLDAADVNEATATGDDTTTSSSYTAMDSMQITPGPGKFALFFTTSAEGDGTDDDVAMAVFVDGVILQHTERLIEQEGSITDSEFVYAIACEVNPGAGEVVEIRWHSQGGATATVHERTLTLWKTEQIQEASATGSTTTTSDTFGLLDSMELTPEAGEYLAIFSAYWEGSSSSAHDLDAIIVEGTTEIPHTQRTSGSDGSTPSMDHVVASNGIVNLDGIENLEIHWRRVDAGTATCHDRTVILISCLAVVEKDAIDTVDLAIDEGVAGLQVQVGPVDTLALAILEGPPAIDVEGVALDDLDLALGEEAAGASEAEVTDTLDLAVLEGPTEVAAGLTAEDDLDLAILEGPAEVAAGIVAQDTLALAIAEATAEILVGVQAIDTLDLALLEQAVLDAAAEVADTLDLAIAEVAQVVVTIVAQDVLDLAIAEAAALVAAGLTTEDTLDLAIAEAAEVVASGVIEKVAADTLGLAIIEAAAQVAVGLTVEDSLGLSIAEGVADLLAKADPVDTTGLTADEISNLLAAASRLDGLDLALGELAEVAAAIDSFDTLSITIDDAGQVTVAIDAADNLDLALAELAQLLALLGASDTLDIVLDEAAQVLALIARSDTLSIVIDDAGQVAVQVTASDQLDLAIIEGPGQVVVGIVAADTLALAIAEASQVLAFLQRADTLNLALVEGVPVLFATASAEDTIDLAIDDQATVQVPIEASDLLALAIDEISQVVVAIQATDLLALTVDEIQTLAGFLNRSDIAGLALGEDAQVAVFLQALDTLDLAIDDASDLVVALQAADALDISIAEFSQLFLALSAADTLGLRIDEVSDVFKETAFDGVIVQPFTLVACREAAFTLVACREVPITLVAAREVQFTLQIEGSGEQIP